LDFGLQLDKCAVDNLHVVAFMQTLTGFLRRIPTR